LEWEYQPRRHSLAPIYAGKAKSMVVVMPAEQTRASGFALRGRVAADGAAARPPVDEFAQAVLNDIMPYARSEIDPGSQPLAARVAGM